MDILLVMLLALIILAILAFIANVGLKRDKQARPYHYHFPNTPKTYRSRSRYPKTENGPYHWFRLDDGNYSWRQDFHDGTSEVGPVFSPEKFARITEPLVVDGFGGNNAFTYYKPDTPHDYLPYDVLE